MSHLAHAGGEGGRCGAPLYAFLSKGTSEEESCLLIKRSRWSLPQRRSVTVANIALLLVLATHFVAE